MSLPLHFHVSPCHLLCKDIVDSSFSLHLKRRESVERTLENKCLFWNNYFAIYVIYLTTFIRRLLTLFSGFHFVLLWSLRLIQNKTLFLRHSTMTYFRREVVGHGVLLSKIKYFYSVEIVILHFRNPELIYTCEGCGMLFFKLFPVL